jgi:hypothetical protein
MTDRLDDLIEQGLAASFARIESCPPPQPRYLASRSATRRWRVAPALAGLPAALGTKVAVALAAATIAGTGVAAKAAFTGNPNPLTWGGQAQVQPPARACAGEPCPGIPLGGRAATPEARPTPAATASPGADHGGASVALPSADEHGDSGGRAHGADGGGATPGRATTTNRDAEAEGQAPAAGGPGLHGTPGHGPSDGGERPDR